MPDVGGVGAEGVYAFVGADVVPGSVLEFLAVIRAGNIDVRARFFLIFNHCFSADIAGDFAVDRVLVRMSARGKAGGGLFEIGGVFSELRSAVDGAVVEFVGKAELQESPAEVESAQMLDVGLHPVLFDFDGGGLGGSQRYGQQ